jgi:hypothetical protein
MAVAGRGPGVGLLGRRSTGLRGFVDSLASVARVCVVWNTIYCRILPGAVVARRIPWGPRAEGGSLLGVAVDSAVGGSRGGAPRGGRVEPVGPWRRGGSGRRHSRVVPVVDRCGSGSSWGWIGHVLCEKVVLLLLLRLLLRIPSTRPLLNRLQRNRGW